MKGTSSKKREKGAIVITGISGALGKILTKKLYDKEKIIGFAKKPFLGKPLNVEIFEMDVRKRRAERIFSQNKIKAVIHLGLRRNPKIDDRVRYEYNIESTVKVFEYVLKYNIPKIILLSSSNAYGPSPSNPIYIKESAPLNGDRNFPEIRDLIIIDMYAQSFFWKYPKIETVILRPVNILGPTVRNAASNYLRLKIVPKIIGYDPMVQVIHEEDVVDSIILAMKPKIKGIFNIVGPPEVPLSYILKLLKKPTYPVPPYFDKFFAKFLWDFKLSFYYPQEWEYLKYSCIVDGSLARNVLKFKHKYSLIDTVLSVLG